MSFSLSELPYSKDGLSPHLSAETIEYHHGKLHKTYIDNLNKLLGEGDKSRSLVDIIKSSDGYIFDNASQIWNSTFYWNCLSPDGGGEPTGDLAKVVDENFGSFIEFKKEFTKVAEDFFGSGWISLIKNMDSSLSIMTTQNAGCPLVLDSVTPILNCNLWEHAYYLDYRNARDKYLKAFWNIVNWAFVDQNYKNHKTS